MGLKEQGLENHQGQKLLEEMRIERERERENSNMSSKSNLRGSTPQHKVSFPEHLPNVQGQRSLLVRAIPSNCFSTPFVCVVMAKPNSADMCFSWSLELSCFAMYALPGDNCVSENIELAPQPQFLLRLEVESQALGN